MIGRIKLAFSARNPHHHLGVLKHVTEAYNLAIFSFGVFCILLTYLAMGISVMDLLGETLPLLTRLIALCLLPVSLAFLLCGCLCVTMIIASISLSLLHLLRALPLSSEI